MRQTWAFRAANQVRASKAHSWGKRTTFALFQCNHLWHTVFRILVLVYRKSAKAPENAPYWPGSGV